MDDDDGDDDCGYLRDRTGERERPSCLPCLVFVQTGVRSWTTEKDANNTLLRGGGGGFQFSAGARAYYEEGT